MPQKPTMPSPYMATVDATEPITFSCTIDNRDTIVDYDFNIEEIGSIEDTSTSTNEEFVLPPIFVGSAKIRYATGAHYDDILLYKESENSTEYTMVVNELNSAIGALNNILEGRINEDNTIISLDNGIEVSTNDITTIIFTPCIDEDRVVIRGKVFSNYPNLKSVYLKGKISDIGGEIFSGSNSIKEFVFPNTLGKFSVDEAIFTGNNSIETITIPHLYLVSRAKTVRVNGTSYYPSTSITTFAPNARKVFISSVNPFDNEYTTNVGMHKCVGINSSKELSYNSTPFKNHKSVEEIVFLSSVTEISKEAFRGCPNLKKITGLKNLKIIGESAFEECVGLSKVFDDFMEVSSVGVKAFQNSGLEEITVTEKMEAINALAFNGCEQLSTIVATSTPQNITVSEQAFGELNTTNEVQNITLYGKSDIMSTDLYHKLTFYYSSVVFSDLYYSDGYTPVPLRGGSALMRTIDKNYLENDKEYYWNVMLKDSFGKTITTPNYYFRTRSNPNISILKISTETTETKDATEVKVSNDDFKCDNDRTITALYTNYNILTEKPFYVDFTPNASLLSEATSLNTYYAEGNKIMNFVGTSVEFTGESIDIEFNEERLYQNNDGIGTVELYRLPIRENSEVLYMVDANLPVTEKITTDDGEEEISYDKLFTIWLKRGTDADKVLQPGIESTVPEVLTIVRISTPHEAEYFSGTINLESGAEYQISYNTGFASDGVYEVTYFYESDVQSYTYTFTGEYGNNDEFSDIVPLESYRWTLYEVIEDKQYLIDDTGIIYGSYPTYTYSMFVPNHDYYLCIEVENDEGVTATSEYKFSVANFEAEMTYVPEISLNKRENAVCIKLEDASVFYSIIRFDVARNSYKLIAESIHGGGVLPRYVYDYTAASNTEYRYIVYALDANNNFSTWSSEIIIPDWCKTSIIGFQGSYIDNSPIMAEKENIWGFGLNVEDITYKQNMSKTLSQGVGSRYAHITSGKTNYKTFDISCLIGDVDNVDYTSDTAILTERWAEFLASPMAKLVVDMKGNVLICDATDASIKSEHNYFEMPTTISASFVEIAPSDKVSIYRIKDGE